MSDHIQLLPDSIANQIAAGEVAQRPASVVKELMENAIDAGADAIQLILGNSGKTLIRVVDNGRGMTEMDARMCFERHATSKIRTAEDLFRISTMGFRGEALASIAAVAKVEMVTRNEFDELGTKIRIEGSKVKLQEPAASSKGTSISVKNLFFNIPARLKFLKSDITEMKHIMDEFNRIVLAYPEIQFSLYHNDKELYRLTKGNTRQRIVSLFGKTLNERLVPVQENIDEFSVDGFITKPEAAKKSREQYIFVNNRFIKSPYLSHAIRSAYEELIPKEFHPPFFLFLNIDPSKVDVNVHPTKQEVKFEEERLIYNYLKVACRHALGRYNITPSLDFNTENEFIGQSRSSGPASFSRTSQLDPLQRKNLEQWKQIYEGMITVETEMPETPVTIESRFDISETSEGLFGTEIGKSVPYQLHQRYIIHPIKSGFLVIDQQAASERVIYEDLLDKIKNKVKPSQKTLFPVTVELSNIQYQVFEEVKNEIVHFGFHVESFGDNTIIVHAVPSILDEKTDVIKWVVELIDEFGAEQQSDMKLEMSLARTLAKQIAIKNKVSLSIEEMQDLVDKLFACEMPFKTPSGKNCFISIELEELKKRLAR